MKTLILLALTLTLTGCGAYGEPLLLARIFDANDQCQLRNNGGKFPEWCGAGSAGRTTIYATPNNAPIGASVGYTKK